MSIWKKLFGKVNIQKTFDTIAGGIDNLAFTKQEKAEINKEMVQSQLEFYKQTLNESSARSLTRRYIAVSVVAVYLFLILLGTGAFLINPTYSEFVFKVMGELTTPFVVILSFYFGSSLLRTYKSKGEK